MSLMRTLGKPHVSCSRKASLTNTGQRPPKVVPEVEGLSQLRQDYTTSLMN